MFERPRSQDSLPHAGGRLQFLAAAALTLSVMQADIRSSLCSAAEPERPKDTAASPPLSPEQVKILIEQLGNDVFAERNKAMKVLGREPLDLAGLQQVARARNDKDSEIAMRTSMIVDARSRKICEPYAREANIRPTNYPKMPWIDMLPQGVQFPGHDQNLLYPSRSAIIGTYLEKARVNGAPADSSPNWTNFRVASDLFVQDVFHRLMIARLEEGDMNLVMEETRRNLQQLLDTMVENEKKYRENHKLPNVLLP
jgi:hypothetical protein